MSQDRDMTPAADSDMADLDTADLNTAGFDATEFDAELWNGLPLLRVLDLAAAADRLIDAQLRPRGLSLAEVRTLAACAQRPGITAARIAASLPADVPAVSRLVNALHRKGLLSRRRSRSDRRTVMLRPTENGLLLLGQCQALLGVLQEEFLRPLSQRETDALMRPVDRLLEDQP